MPFMPTTTSDFVSNATTASKENVPGLAFPVAANRIYWFRAQMRADVAATTTGLGLGVDFPAGTGHYTATIPSVAAVGTDSVSEGTTATDDTTIQAADTAVAAGTPCWVEGFVYPTAAGEVQIRVDTDAAAAATIKKGAFIQYRDCGAA